MTPEISSLMSDVSCWEFWEYMALLAVLIGVAGESIKEFTDWPKRIGYEKAITRLSMLILIAGLAGESVTQPNTNAANATLVALLNKQTSQLAIDLEKERAKTSARPWTKEQFDSIQEIKGIVRNVGVVSRPYCVECRILATEIEVAMHSAGIQLYDDPAFSGDFGSGIMVKLPMQDDLGKHPLVAALRKAGLNPVAVHHIPEFSKIRTDMPVIFVGERPPDLFASPYWPDSRSSWTVLPLAKQ